MRSRTGCQTCRQRKLKCDEVKPQCGQCKKASRECRPSDGVVFRHQQNASMNGVGEVETNEGNGRLGSFYAYKNTFNERNVWVDVPKHVTFLNITDPYNMDATPEPEYRVASTPNTAPQVEGSPGDNYFRVPYDEAPGLEALSAAAINDFQYLRPGSVTSQTPQESNASPYSSNNLNFILNPPGPEGAMSTTPQIDPALTIPKPLSRRESLAVSDHEVAFLMRHFSEMCGQWMDLFDLGGYFAFQVPIQALTNPLLRYSACAYAAKQLGRVGGRKAVVGGLASYQAEMELFPQPEKVDWMYIGAKYYDKAISLLMAELSNPSSGDDYAATPSLAEEPFSPQGGSSSPRSLPENLGRKRRRISSKTTDKADETLAAAAILCVYEFLDNASTAWARHLSGTKSLFDLADQKGMIAVQSPTSPGSFHERIKPSRGRKATFWNFARQDFLAAFINEGQTRLNTEDIGLWKAAGLQLDDHGFITPSNLEETPDAPPPMGEDMISNALVWLMSKIINFIASGDSIDNVYPQDRSSPAGVIGINQMTLLERWLELEKELEIWYQGLPETFTPCARLPPITDGSTRHESPRTMFSEIWYSIPMCGSTMQSYHMARTILLMNRPHESTARRSTIANRLQSYRAIELEVKYHIHEIIGIALGRPDASVRIHQVQALFVAGQCLTEPRERQVVVDLLRKIEVDLGWASDYRVQQLLKGWE
ncbi:zn 2cys6 transcription factor [Phlyctema vagabunda]|uniref:Zn 2cys6 transcription factor n=1 Tax=Phlyctema vagabunda TaxID=108571 RepID=A0ABR4PPE1_9HELO